MPIVTAPAPPLSAIRRKYEVYTHTIASANNAGAVPVVLLNITGRGILVSYGFLADQDETVTVGTNFDGAGLTNIDIGPSGAGDGILSPSLTIMKGFETSLVVQMDLGAAGQGWFWAVALVE